MRKNIIYSLVGLALLLGTYACSDDDKYSTSVVNQIELFLDDEPWAVNTGLSTKPLFIYKDNGEYFANYTSHYRSSYLMENIGFCQQHRQIRFLARVI